MPMKPVATLIIWLALFAPGEGGDGDDSRRLASRLRNLSASVWTIYRKARDAKQGRPTENSYVAFTAFHRVCRRRKVPAIEHRHVNSQTLLPVWPLMATYVTLFYGS